MRALIEGRRNGDVGALLSLAGVICLLIASLGLNIKQSRDLTAVKKTLIARCELRQAQDVATRDDLQQRIDLYAAVVKADQRLTNAEHQVPLAVFTDRMAAYQMAMEAAQHRLDSIGPPTDCTKAYASGP